MSPRWRWLAGVVSRTQGSWLLGRVRARGRDGADDVDAEVLGWSQLREWLAGDVVWEVLAGVEDADRDLARERRKGGHQEMRVIKVDTKKQTGKVGKAYSRRS